MDFAIIAAAEGSRLAKSGYPYPKPLARLNGIPLIERLITTFVAHGADTIHIIVNEESTELAESLHSNRENTQIRVVQKSTPSSLHSFYELLKEVPNIEELCATTVDTIFKEEEFSAYLEEFRRNTSLDALMAVTQFVEDESPLYVRTNACGDVNVFTVNNEVLTTILLFGAIYAVRRRLLVCMLKAIDHTFERMRNFQSLL